MSEDHLFPPEYYEDVRRMDEAARAWYKAHPFGEPRFRLGAFEAEIKRQAGRSEEDKVAIAANHNESIIERIAVNEDARSLLRAMDAATDHRATYMQAKVLLDAAIESQIKRDSGQQPEGDWSCPACNEVLDGYTVIDGGGGKAPPPGSISICAYCGGISSVNATQNGLRVLAEAELRKLPTSVRKQIHAARNAIRARIEREKSQL